MCRCVVVQKKPVVSCPFFRTFSSHGILEATEAFVVRFFVYRTLFWNKFVVYETLNTKENHEYDNVSAFV
jgi:hypothetical protein